MGKEGPGYKIMLVSWNLVEPRSSAASIRPCTSTYTADFIIAYKERNFIVVYKEISASGTRRKTAQWWTTRP